MTEPNHSNPTDRSATKSSMSVSQEIMCEGEACIGKMAGPEHSTSAGTATSEKKESSGSSMGIAGKEICSGEACIGKD